MRFTSTPIAGAYVIDLEQRRDERGFFARVWCQRELEAHGLNGRFVQCNDSLSHERGTLRGLHYQMAPHGEAKLVSWPHLRCARRHPGGFQHISAVVWGRAHRGKPVHDVRA
jgi:dTDP-4-dehydrorhamnose 3,5-epimerase